MLAYVASEGAEGIVGSSSFKVRARTVPDNQVNVLPGAALILNKSLTSSLYQSYASRAASATLHAISPTTSAGGRSDLVILRIEDPQYSPWGAPASVPNGPYAFIRVIENVPSGTTDLRDLAGAYDYPAITLARVTLPASTATVQNSHITDLRGIARARLAEANRTYRPTGVNSYGVTGATVTLSTSYQTWPTSWTGRIPDWATTLSIRVYYSGVALRGADLFEDVRVSVNAGGTTLLTIATTVDINKAGETWNGERVMYLHADQLSLPIAMRGKVATFALQVKSNGVGDLGQNLDTASVVAIDLLYSEQAE